MLKEYMPIMILISLSIRIKHIKRYLSLLTMSHTKGLGILWECSDLWLLGQPTGENKANSKDKEIYY